MPKALRRALEPALESVLGLWLRVQTPPVPELENWALVLALTGRVQALLPQVQVLLLRARVLSQQAQVWNWCLNLRHRRRRGYTPRQLQTSGSVSVSSWKSLVVKPIVSLLNAPTTRHPLIRGVSSG